MKVAKHGWAFSAPTGVKSWRESCGRWKKIAGGSSPRQSLFTAGSLSKLYSQTKNHNNWAVGQFVPNDIWTSDTAGCLPTEVLAAEVKTEGCIIVIDNAIPIYLFRRRLSAEGAKPESNNRWKSELGHVCMYGIWNYLANQGT